MFSIGDYVRISPASEYYGDEDDEFNPMDEIGVIKEIYIFDEDMRDNHIWVGWLAGSNTYRDKDLLLINLDPVRIEDVL